MSDEILLQEQDEELVHFIQRVVERWEKQGGIIVDEEILAEYKKE